MRALRKSVCCAVLVALAATGTTQAQGSASSVPELDPGTYVRALQVEPGVTLPYAISVPQTYSASARVPLVLALHFGVGGRAGSGAGRDILRLLVGPALADLGAVIVAPDSLGGSWDVERNEAAVMRLLEETRKAYSIDPGKIVVTGFSMGGRGTWHFAARYPETFSAALPVAGRPPEEAGDWRVPVFAVHSRRDDRVPIGPTMERMAALERQGLNARLVVLDDLAHHQTNLYAPALSQAVPWLEALWKD